MDRVKLDFSENANSYDGHAHIQREVGERLLARLKIFTIKPKVILDLGSGTGFCGQKLKTMFPKAKIINLDFAFNMCKKATQNKQTVVCADINHLPIRPNSIDLVVSNFTFQWCENLPKIFTVIQTITKPDGMFLFTTVGFESLVELRQSWLAIDNYPRVKEFLDMHQIGDFLLQAGWQQPLVDVDRITEFYPQVMDLLVKFKALGVTNKSQDRIRGLTGKNKFRQFIDNYEALRTSEGLPLSWEVIYGFAKAKSGVNFTL